MMDLLKEFSVTQILIFIVLCAIAIKGMISFFDWAGSRMKEKVHKDERTDEIEQKLDIIEATHCRHIDSLKAKDKELQNQLEGITDKIDLLVNSDKDDIKAWITEQYHKFKKQGTIDNYSLDCIERRYSHYKKEHGNSFVDTLMNELRSLEIKI